MVIITVFCRTAKTGKIRILAIFPKNYKTDEKGLGGFTPLTTRGFSFK